VWAGLVERNRYEAGGQAAYGAGDGHRRVVLPRTESLRATAGAHREFTHMTNYGTYGTLVVIRDGVRMMRMPGG